MFLTFLPLPSPSNKAGWAFTVNCSGIMSNMLLNIIRDVQRLESYGGLNKFLLSFKMNEFF